MNESEKDVANNMKGNYAKKKLMVIANNTAMNSVTTEIQCLVL